MKRTAGIAALSFAVALVPAALRAATRVDDPVKFVTMVYAAMKHDRNYQPPSDIYTPALAALFKLDEKEAHGDAPRLDSDFWSNSQDPEITDFHVGKKTVENAPDRLIVDVKFKQGGGANENYFFFVKTAVGWKLDDEVSTVAGYSGADALSLTLKFGANDDPVTTNGH